jgi:hypothetical protein
VNTERGRGQLILYAAPQANTGTDGWGTEVSVGADGTVLDVSGDSGDHAIPEGGFVLSARGGRGRSRELRALSPGDRMAVLDAKGQWIGGSEPIALFVEFPGGQVLPIDGDDIAREAGQLVRYHSGYGEGQVPTGEQSIAVVVRKGRVATVNEGAGETTIPEDGYVLAADRGEGSGQAGELSGLRPGDAIRLLVEKGGRRQYLDEALAERRTHFLVGARCAALYLSVASDRRSSPGVSLGEWRVRYADGTAESIPCRYGREALSGEPEALPVTLTDPVWLVDLPEKRFLVEEWQNPHPEKVVEGLAFTPGQAVLEVGARVVAATAAVE